MAEDSSSGRTNLSFLRVLRILRLVRLVRLARVLRFVRQLRTLVCSIGVSMQSLGWTVMLIMLLIYVIGIYFTQSVSAQKREGGDLNSATFISLDYYFGTLGRSILTLFEAITGGVDWDELCNPLIAEISTFTGLLFCCYILFAVFALMNVVTGVFVESALQGSAQDKESQIVGTLEDLFVEFDVDNSGTIAEEEFHAMLQDAGAISQFKALDVNMHQAKSLFHLIDIERTGVIDIDAFIMGCLRLRGTARAADMTTLIYELKRFMSKWQSHAVFLESEVTKLAQDGRSERSGSKHRCLEASGSKDLSGTHSPKPEEEAVEVLEHSDSLPAQQSRSAPIPRGPMMQRKSIAGQNLTFGPALGKAEKKSMMKSLQESLKNRLSTGS